MLGAAGLLAGKRATTHWAYLDRLRELGADPVSERVVEDGKVITAAGVSAGIDMALGLAARIAGEQVAHAIQLGIEYDPQPPFDSGSPAKASPELIELVRARRGAIVVTASHARAPPPLSRLRQLPERSAEHRDRLQLPVAGQCPELGLEHRARHFRSAPRARESRSGRIARLPRRARRVLLRPLRPAAIAASR